jgi:hypothetical protein
MHGTAENDSYTKRGDAVNMADYWMKLYIEILDDPKMAMLPDRIWRRFIELCLLAKRAGADGHLPDTRQIAWSLRMIPDELESDLAQIATTGIIEREINGWFIPKFAQRQAAVPDAERKAQERLRKKSQQYYGDVTMASRNVTQSTEDRLTESEAEAEAEAEGKPSEPAAAAAMPTTGYLSIFTNVTQMAGIPNTEQEKVLGALNTLSLRYPGKQALIDYLRPFWLEWSQRKTKNGQAFSRSNCAWCYDWAVAGEIPPAPSNNGSGNHTPAPAAGTEFGRVLERIAREGH